MQAGNGSQGLGWRRSVARPRTLHAARPALVGDSENGRGVERTRRAGAWRVTVMPPWNRPVPTGPTAKVAGYNGMGCSQCSARLLSGKPPVTRTAGIKPGRPFSELPAILNAGGDLCVRAWKAGHLSADVVCSAISLGSNRGGEGNSGDPTLGNVNDDVGAGLPGGGPAPFLEGQA